MNNMEIMKSSDRSKNKRENALHKKSLDKFNNMVASKVVIDKDNKSREE